MSDTDDVVYSELNLREDAQRSVLHHGRERDEAPVYLVEMPNDRPEVDPEKSSRRSRRASIISGGAFELPESEVNALEQYVRKNIDGFRRSLSPEDLDVESRRRSIKYIEKGGDVIITPEDVQGTEENSKETNDKENNPELKRTNPSMNVSYDAIDEGSKQKRESDRAKTSRGGVNNTFTVLPVGLDTRPKGSPFDDKGRRNKSRLKVMLEVESAEDLSKAGKKRKRDSHRHKGSSRKQSVSSDSSQSTKQSSESSSSTEDSSISEDNTQDTKRKSKPKSSNGQHGKPAEAVLKKGKTKRNSNSESQDGYAKDRVRRSKGNGIEENVSSPRSGNRDEAKQLPTTRGTPALRNSGLSTGDDENSGSRPKKVSFADTTSEDELKMPFGGSTSTKIYRAEGSQQNPFSQGAKSSKSRQESDKEKTKSKPGGDKRIYAKAPVSKKEMYAMKRYHIQLTDKEREETPFCVRFNVTEENDVDMTYDGAVKITNYFSTNKYK